ncbi:MULTISPECIES: type ISP restriction/modification enzyme [unclassified Nocardiopsis]|uniref:type ISP restriction/modification enzyme n=1 Tax=Nocardiopsis TaxID=2013 RepID=UPI00387B91BC
MTALPYDPDETPPAPSPEPRARGISARLVRTFIKEVTESLGRGGQDEEQLRSPAKDLVQSLGAALGVPNKVYGEVRLPELRARPDFGVDFTGISRGPNSRIGYIELKRPGSPLPPSPYLDKRDREQWEKFQRLPNVLYSNGTQWALFRMGEQRGRTVTTPDFTTRRIPSAAIDPAFERLIQDFLTWSPEPEHDLDRLISRLAHLCAQMRDEVVDILAEESTSPRGNPFTRLAQEWRDLLFPHLEPGPAFADVYAQTITFSLLLARESGVGFTGRSVREIGELLGKRHPFLGEAFAVLTSSPTVQEQTVLPMLIRILEPVDWQRLVRSRRSAHTDLYETFLERYDPELRKSSGSYYTPEPVARFMVEFTDSLLGERLHIPLGIADEAVTTVDPAMGSGTFLSAVMDRAARTLTAEFGTAHARTHLKDLYRDRLIGFERSTAAFSVAELRLHQLLQEKYSTEVPDEHHRFLSNTLDDPHHVYEKFGMRYDEIIRFREAANHVKRTTRVMAVIGNPPYIRHAKRNDPAPWLEKRREAAGDPVTARPSMDEFREPGNGALEFKLSAVSLYFWRWATWKVFDAHPDRPSGVVAFVSTSAYLTQNAFAGMRRYLRETADEGWIIDLSPEGHQSPVNTRVFGGVQQPICIGIFARYGRPRPDTPARIRYNAVEGTKEAKFAALAHDPGLRLDGDGWRECDQAWTAPFRPVGAEWEGYPAAGDLFPWHSPGVKANRTWVIAPDRRTLEQRWNRLASADPRHKDGLFKATGDRDTRRRFPGRRAVSEETRSPGTAPIAHRVFDRQYFIDDERFVDRPRPALRGAHGPAQIHAVEAHTNTITSGPGLVFTSLVPDNDYFQGHHGGRVLPLYRTAGATSPNLARGLLGHLSKRLGRPVSPEDVMSYLAAVVSHPGYTERFRERLRVPGIRVPLTTDPLLWGQAVGLGRQVIWLHTYGDRCTDVAAGRPPGPPRLPAHRRPTVLEEIPNRIGRLPEHIRFEPGDDDTGRLHVGDGVIAPVSPAVWAYDVGGMRVVDKWFSARQGGPRRGRRGSPLDDIRPERWTTRFTDDLLRLLAVLTRLVDLEPAQRELLDRVLDGPLVSTDDLTRADVLPVSPVSRKAPRPGGQEELPLV